MRKHTCRACGEAKPTEDFYVNSGHRRHECKVCTRIARKEWYDAHGRDAYYQRTYGITAAEFDARWQMQKGRCAICQEPTTDPHLDHDHTTGANRDLLCQACNTALGKMHDDVGTLLRAVKYLRRHGKDLPIEFSDTGL